MNKVYLFLSLFLSISLFASEGESFGVIAPYMGRLTSEYSNSAYRLDLKESGVMTGAFAQWIDPKYFQANAFFYFAPKAEMTDVAGTHLNADYYPVDFSFGKLVTGLDVELIKIHTTGSLPGLESFDLINDVGTFMPRVGLNAPFKVHELVALTAFPYVGATYETVSGEVAIDPMGPPTKRTSPISQKSGYASAGLNLTVNVAHFFEIQGKYLGGLKSEGRLDSFGILANVFVSRTLAISYRFKHVEFPNRSNEYHLIGLAAVL